MLSSLAAVVYYCGDGYGDCCEVLLKKKKKALLSRLTVRSIHGALIFRCKI